MMFFDPGPKTRNPDNRAGFTAVELVVSMGVFSILLGIATGGMVHSLRTQRHITAIVAAQSTMSQAIEQISREIRTGSDFIGDCVGGSTLSFTNDDLIAVTYGWETNSFGGFLSRQEGAGTVEAITAENADVRSVDFCVQGAVQSPPAGDNLPPRITMIFEVAPAASDIGAPIIVQTTISPRFNYDGE